MAKLIESALEEKDTYTKDEALIRMLYSWRHHEYSLKSRLLVLLSRW